MRKKVYISLPIKGRSETDVRKHNEKAVNRLVELGLDPISPLDNGLPYDAPDDMHMARDFRTITECDAIYLCDGWEYSHGCMDELAVAADCRLAVVYEHMRGADIMWKTK